MEKLSSFCKTYFKEICFAGLLLCLSAILIVILNLEIELLGCLIAGSVSLLGLQLCAIVLGKNSTTQTQIRNLRWLHCPGSALIAVLVIALIGQTMPDQLTAVAVGMPVPGYIALL